MEKKEKEWKKRNTMTKTQSIRQGWMYRPDIPLRRSSYKSAYTCEEQIRYNTERRKPYFNPDLLPGRPPPESFSKCPREPFVEEPIPRDEYLKKNNVQRSTFKPEQEPDVFHLLKHKGGRVKVLSKSNGTVQFEPITSFEVTTVRYSFDYVANKPVVEILKPATPITDFEIPKPGTPITDPMMLEDAAASASSGGTKPAVEKFNPATADSTVETTFATFEGTKADDGDPVAQESTHPLSSTLTRVLAETFAESPNPTAAHSSVIAPDSGSN